MGRRAVGDLTQPVRIRRSEYTSSGTVGERLEAEHLRL